MPKFDGFVGPAYQARSRRFDAQRLENMYVELNESKTSDDAKALLATPGLRKRITMPVPYGRGLVAGHNRMFAVYGSTLYEIFHVWGVVTTDGALVAWNAGPYFTADLAGVMIEISGRTYLVASVTDRENLVLTESAGVQTGVSFTGPTTHSSLGDVGDDQDHSIAQMFLNGNEIFIASAGFAWLHDGVTLDHSLLSNGEGTVSTSGTAVLRISGSAFDNSLIGNPFFVEDVEYTVASVTDADNLTLTTSAGTQTDCRFTITPIVSGNVSVTGTAIELLSGSQFSTAMTGRLIYLEDIPYTITSVADATHLTLSDDAGLADTAYFRSTLTPLHGTASVDHTTLTWLSGDTFDPNTQASTAEVEIGGGVFFVKRLTSATELELSTDAGILNAASYRAYTWLPVRMGAYIDTKYIAQIPDTNNFRTSTAKDGRFFDGADVEEKEGAPDRLMGILADHSELWLFGHETTEVWADTGTGTTSGFSRQYVIQQGTVAPYAAVSLDNGVAWITADVRGRGIAVFARGYIPQPISTTAVESKWATYATLEDAVAYSYQESGHTFWVIHFPSANATWAYDATSGTWAERPALVLNRRTGTGIVNVAGTAVTYVSGIAFNDSMIGQPFFIDGTEYTVLSHPSSGSIVLTTSAGTATNAEYDSYQKRWQVNRRCHCYAFGKHWVADAETGDLYEQSLDYWHDDGAPIRRLRSAPHINDEQKFMYHHRLQIDLQAGEGKGPYTDLHLGGGGTTGTSVLQPFTLADIGMWIQVTGGTGFTPKRARVVSVAGNVATFSKSLGTAGSSGGQAVPDPPLIKMRQSKNGGKSWTAGRSVTAGVVDTEDLQRVNYRRLGYARNMTYEISSLARIPHAWINAIIELTDGLA